MGFVVLNCFVVSCSADKQYPARIVRGQKLLKSRWMTCSEGQLRHSSTMIEMAVTTARDLDAPPPDCSHGMLTQLIIPQAERQSK